MPSSCKVNSVCVRLAPSPIPLSGSSGHGAAASQPTSRTDFLLSRTFVGCDNSGRVRMAASMACRKLLPNHGHHGCRSHGNGTHLLQTKAKISCIPARLNWKRCIEKLHVQCGNSRRPPGCLQVVLFQGFLGQLDHGCTGNIRKQWNQNRIQMTQREPTWSQAFQCRKHLETCFSF